jgi:hypothetical protein
MPPNCLIDIRIEDVQENATYAVVFEK